MVIKMSATDANIELMNQIRDYFDFGTVNVNINKGFVRYQVDNKLHHGTLRFL